MSMPSMPRRAARLLAAALCLVCAVAPATAGGDSEQRPLRVSLPAGAGTAVQRALLSARRRLGEPECRRVFAEFHAESLGRPLARELELRGRTPEQQLDAVLFKDGSGTRECGRPTVLAFTRPGSDAVFVCAGAFTRATAGDPTLGEVVLIHELLHTLGLGEDPPSSREITERVAQRCGDFRTTALPAAAACPGSVCPETGRGCRSAGRAPARGN